MSPMIRAYIPGSLGMLNVEGCNMLWNMYGTCMEHVWTNCRRENKNLQF